MRGDLADDKNNRRPQPCRPRRSSDFVQRRVDPHLVRQADVTQDCDRRRRWLTGGDQRARPMVGRRHAHVKHERAGKSGESGKIESGIGFVGVFLPGDERDRRSRVSVRHGNARIAGRSKCGSHARDNFEGNSVGDQAIQLLGGMGENHGVAALEANDRLALPRVLTEQAVDLGLRFDPPATVLAKRDQNCIMPAMAENRRIDQVVIRNDIGPPQQFDRAQRHQARIARPRPDQIDFTDRHSFQNNLMPADPPASPLITPDLRRRLQQRYEEAVRHLNQQPTDHARVHELLAECLRADPGNILYLDALLANLRQWQPSSQDRDNWFRWWKSSGGKSTEYSVLSTQYFADGAIDQIIAQRLLLRAPELLHDGFNDSATLVGLAAACAASDFDQAEVRYLQTARQAASEDVDVLRLLARTLTRQGNFEETALLWPKLQSQQPDAESQQAIADLQAEKNYESADRLLAEAGAAGGENLAVRREREELRLSRAEQQLAIARRRAASDKHPKAQSLVPRLEAELLRQQIEILHLRCERLPGDMHLRLELARKLKQAGNYSGAIQRLEEVRSDAVLAAEVLLELGECWQHLRQFEKALDFYWQAITTSNGNQQPRPMVAALYRVGVLAAAMGKASEAREALTRLVEKDHGYKDARERLDKLPAN